MGLLFKHFWLLCLAVLGLNYWLARRRLPALCEACGRDIAQGERYLQRFAMAGSIPWLIAAWSMLVGDVPSMGAFTHPESGNPYVIAWLGSIWLLVLVYTAWVWLADGAAQVLDFQLMAVVGGPFYGSTVGVKVMALLMPILLAGILWLQLFLR